MATTTEKIILSDEQLGDMRAVLDSFADLKNEDVGVVQSAAVRVTGNLIVTVQYDEDRDEFVVVL